jgi:hypothetical protein
MKSSRTLRANSTRGAKKELVPDGLAPEDCGGIRHWDPLYGGPIPEFDENALPDATQMYSFAVRQMALLAAACPVLEVRKAAAEFLVKEFAPVRSGGVSEKDRFVIELRREIARFTEGGGVRKRSNWKTKPAALLKRSVRRISMECEV